MASDDEFASALKAVGTFLDRAPLTDSIANIEGALKDSTQTDVQGLIDEAGVTPELFESALIVRERIGRINDVVHASAILLALPDVLEPGEVLARPSLGAGNDKSRPYDLETNRRVAEFKLARWRGKDAMRKRQTFKDLVHLAAEESDRDAELYVLGDMPIRFLKTSKSKASWGLDRSPPIRKLFEERFGSLEMGIADFTKGPGAHVKIIDLEQRLPDLFAS